MVFFFFFLAEGHVNLTGNISWHSVSSQDHLQTKFRLQSGALIDTSGGDRTGEGGLRVPVDRQSPLERWDDHDYTQSSESQ